MHPKLVRNRIPTIIAEDKNRIAYFYQAENKEYWERLKEKLIEETQEFIRSEELIELSDILEVIEALALAKNSSLLELMEIKRNKAQSHGSFSDRIVLSAIEEL